MLAVLATWRVTHLLAAEDGPADLIARFRALFGRGSAGKLLDCFNCLSLWIAALSAFAITPRFPDCILIWLALSGAACLLERLGREPVVIEPEPQTSEGENNYVLWPETSGVAQRCASGPRNFTGGDV